MAKVVINKVRKEYAGGVVAVTLAVNPHDLPEGDASVLEFCPLMNRAHFFDEGISA